MDRDLTMQDVLRAVLERRTHQYKRAGLAERLGISMASLDYLRAGERKIKGKKQINFISFEHLEKLARSEGSSFFTILDEVAREAKQMEEKHRAEMVRELNKFRGRSIEEELVDDELASPES